MPDNLLLENILIDFFTWEIHLLYPFFNSSEERFEKDLPERFFWKNKIELYNSCYTIITFSTFFLWNVSN